MRPTLPPPLRRRGFRLFMIAQLGSLIGDFFMPIALAFAVLDLTGSASDLGLVLAAQVAPAAVLLLVGGAWADRRPRRALMVATDLVRAGTQGTVAVLLLTGHARVWELVALQAAWGRRRRSTGRRPLRTGPSCWIPTR